LGVNHGGVTIVAAAGVRLASINVGFQPATFEYTAAHVTSCVAAVVYRPGSSAVTAEFFTELAELLDRLSVSSHALVLASDVNIRLERATNPDAVEFRDLLTGYGLTQHVSCSTHDAGGSLDVVCTQNDLPSPSVNIVDMGLSDHRLLLCSSSMLRPPPVYVKLSRRAWRVFTRYQSIPKLAAVDRPMLAACRAGLSETAELLVLPYRAIDNGRPQKYVVFPPYLSLIRFCPHLELLSPAPRNKEIGSPTKNVDV